VTDRYRSGAVWTLFGPRYPSAMASVQRSAIAAGYGKIGSGHQHLWSPVDLAVLLAVADLGSGRHDRTAPEPVSQAVARVVRGHLDGWIVAWVDVRKGGRFFTLPEWHLDLSTVEAMAGPPVVVASVADYHRRVAEFLAHLETEEALS
jgi:hypothetical protein